MGSSNELIGVSQVTWCIDHVIVSDMDVGELDVLLNGVYFQLGDAVQYKVAIKVKVDVYHAGVQVHEKSTHFTTVTILGGKYRVQWTTPIVPVLIRALACLVKPHTEHLDPVLLGTREQRVNEIASVCLRVWNGKVICDHTMAKINFYKVFFK